MRSSFRILARAGRPAGASSAPRSSRLRAVIASVLSVVLIGGGLALVGAAPAEAHDQDFQVSCSALSVDLQWYQPGDPDPNRFTATIDGAVEEDVAFSVNHTFSTTFDPYTAHTYRIVVVAADDAPGPDGNGAQGWSRVYEGTTTPCAKPATPTVQVAASTCSTVDGNTSLSATVGNLDATRSYTAVLTGPGVSDSRPITGVTSASFAYGTHPAGATYTVKVTDDAEPTIAATSSVTAKSCPQVGDVSAEIEQCTTPGGSGGIVFTSFDLAVGHVYELRSGSTTGTVLGSFTYAANQTSYRLALAAGQTYSLYLVDQQGGVLQLGPIPVELQVCPSTPSVVALTPAACTVGATTSDITVQLGNLTSGRTYQLYYDGAPSGGVITASGTTESTTIANASPGAHTVTVVDTASGVSSATASVTVAQCATEPVVSVAATQCSTPTGTGSLAVTLTGLTAGRSYQVTLTSGGRAVAQYPASTLTASGTSATVSFTGLTAGAAYAVTATDTADARATATSTTTLAACPPVPTLSALVASCSVSGTSTIQAAAADVASGQVWDVQLLKADSTGAYVLVADRPNLAGTALTSDALRFTGVQNGASYRVTLASQTTAGLTAQASIVPARCAVGGVEYIADPGTTAISSLARTGADAVGPAALALILLQLGIALVAIAAIRRRKEADN